MVVFSSEPRLGRIYKVSGETVADRSGRKELHISGIAIEATAIPQADRQTFEEPIGFAYKHRSRVTVFEPAA
jgi:hypothetical protein